MCWNMIFFKHKVTKFSHKNQSNETKIISLFKWPVVCRSRKLRKKFQQWAKYWKFSDIQWDIELILSKNEMKSIEINQLLLQTIEKEKNWNENKNVLCAHVTHWVHSAHFYLPFKCWVNKRKWRVKWKEIRKNFWPLWFLCTHRIVSILWFFKLILFFKLPKSYFPFN